MIDFYARQLHLALRWAGGRGALVWRAVETLVVAVLALTVTASLIPGVRIRDVPSLVGAAIVLAALRTLLRPVLIAFLSALPLIVATLATVLIQALVFWLISVTGAMAMGGLTDALAASIAFSIGTALLTATLSTGDDNAFFGTLVRQLAARNHERARSAERGVIFIQIDGLAHSILEAQIRAGRTPTIAGWISSGAMTLDKWEPLLPTQTSASQAGILHGNNDGIPAFRWWDKEAGRLLVSNNPKDAREIERRIASGTKNGGLLANGGASIGNLLSGGASRSFLTASTIDDPAHEIRRSHVLDWFFVSPYSYVRWILLSIGEVIKEVFQAFLERRSGIEPRGPRRFPYPLARAATNVLLRHLTTSLVIEEMYRRVSAIYVDYVDYDEIAHHVGPDRIEARDAIAGLDKIVGIIARAAADAPMAYRLAVLSDHGQSPGAMFEQRYQKTLEQLIQELVGERVSVKGATAPLEHWGRLTPLLSAASGIEGLTERLTGGPFRRRAGGAESSEEPPAVVVAASGNLALMSFPAMPGRATMQAINGAYPGLIDGLTRHPGIGCVMVRCDDGTSVVLGARGTLELANGRIEGGDPVAQFGPRALEGLRRVDAMRDCGDLVIVSQFDPASGEVAAFESQIGSHGGIGGKQTEAFILHPAEWRLDAPVVGAVTLHERIRHWLS